MLSYDGSAEHQAVTKDLTSSSKFSGSCVLTLQTLPAEPTQDRNHRPPARRSDNYFLKEMFIILLTSINI